jgi:uncharacterized protein (UPF0335 family)
MVDGALLHRTISEYERLDAERMATQESQAEVIKGAVEQGLDKTILKRLIRELRRDAALMRAERDLLDEYRDAWLTWEATPLGAHAKGSSEPQDGKSQMKRARAAKKAGDVPTVVSVLFGSDKEILAEAAAREAAIDTSEIPDDAPGRAAAE